MKLERKTENRMKEMRKNGRIRKTESVRKEGRSEEVDDKNGEENE